MQTTGRPLSLSSHLSSRGLLFSYPFSLLWPTLAGSWAPSFIIHPRHPRLMIVTRGVLIGPRGCGIGHGKWMFPVASNGGPIDLARRPPQREHLAKDKRFFSRLACCDISVEYLARCSWHAARAIALVHDETYHASSFEFCAVCIPW